MVAYLLFREIPPRSREDRFAGRVEVNSKLKIQGLGFFIQL